MKRKFLVVTTAIILSLALCVNAFAFDGQGGFRQGGPSQGMSMGQPTGNPPEKPNGEEPPEKPDGEPQGMTNGEEPPEKPDGEPQGMTNGEEPPEKPDGEPQGMPSGMGTPTDFKEPPEMPNATPKTSATDAVVTVVTTGDTTSYSVDGDNSHAITVDGEDASYEDIVVNKTGDGEGDNADFYGENAAVFATNGATLTISNAEITTDGKYANGVFSYGEGTTVNISDSTITTSQRNSGGIMVTGGGTLNADNLTIETEGGSSAAIRSDRGGGTINVDGGSYTANGSGSPAIYSTADINVSNATLKSGSAQAVVVEGGNKVTLNDCEVIGNNTVHNSNNSTYYQAVMLYQSMSGDAASGDGSFTMDGGSLTSLNGGMFFVTNATYAINLSDVDLTYADDELLRICSAGWGNSGSNGGQVTFNADSQELEGDIIVDDISKLNMYLTDGSNFIGSFENDGEVYLEISEDSTWTLTSDCNITSLNCTAGSINLNGYTLTVDGEEYVEDNSSTGTAVTFTASESNEMNFDKNSSGMPNGNSNNKPSNKPSEKPSDKTSDTPPEKPSEESNEATYEKVSGGNTSRIKQFFMNLFGDSTNV